MAKKLSKMQRALLRFNDIDPKGMDWSDFQYELERLKKKGDPEMIDVWQDYSHENRDAIEKGGVDFVPMGIGFELLAEKRRLREEKRIEREQKRIAKMSPAKRAEYERQQEEIRKQEAAKKVSFWRGCLWVVAAFLVFMVIVGSCSGQ